jgi:hypothetical protein
MNSNTIYLLQTREFIQLKQPVYKIGRTNQPLEKRFKQYPKGSQLLYSNTCCNSVNTETILLRYFKEQFKHRGDIGKEYFEGNPYKMIEIIDYFCKNNMDFKTENINDYMVDDDYKPTIKIKVKIKNVNINITNVINITNTTNYNSNDMMSDD